VLHLEMHGKAFFGLLGHVWEIKCAVCRQKDLATCPGWGEINTVLTGPFQASKQNALEMRVIDGALCVDDVLLIVVTDEHVNLDATLCDGRDQLKVGLVNLKKEMIRSEEKVIVSKPTRRSDDRSGFAFLGRVFFYAHIQDWFIITKYLDLLTSFGKSNHNY